MLILVEVLLYQSKHPLLLMEVLGLTRYLIYKNIKLSLKKTIKNGKLKCSDPKKIINSNSNIPTLLQDKFNGTEKLLLENGTNGP
jgi:hypothetical protein